MALGKGHELGGAHRGEVGRVREQHQPLALVVFQLLDAMGGLGLESRGRLVQTGKAEGLLLNIFHWVSLASGCGSAIWLP